VDAAPASPAAKLTQPMPTGPPPRTSARVPTLVRERRGPFRQQVKRARLASSSSPGPFRTPPRHILGALDKLVFVDGEAVREHFARTRTMNCASGYSAISGSFSSMLATPFSRIRWRASKSMNSSPTCGFFSRLPIERYIPLPS
jgi:hypothetical protein